MSKFLEGQRRGWRVAEAFGRDRATTEGFQFSQGLLGCLRKGRSRYQANFATGRGRLVLEFGRSSHKKKTEFDSGRQGTCYLLEPHRYGGGFFNGIEIAASVYRIEIVSNRK